MFTLKDGVFKQFLKYKNKNVFNLERQEFPSLFNLMGQYMSQEEVFYIIKN